MRKLLCLLLILCLIPFTAPAEEDNCDWLIYVYICGSDLESEGGAASADMYEMMNASTGSNSAFLVCTGGAYSWDNDFVSSDSIGYWLITEGEVYECDSAEGLMSDPDTLHAFIAYGEENIPADHTGLILWNHGGGSITGVCFDETDDNTSLSLSQIDTALTGTHTFDFVGFDACLMGTYEAAAMLSSHAQYMIGSEETEDGTGWDYTELGDALNGGCDMVTLGKNICDGYYAQSEAYGEPELATLSFIDLSKIPALTSALNDVSHDLLGSMSSASEVTAITRGITAAEKYGSNDQRNGYTNMVDLGGILRKTSDIVDTSAAQEALSAAVVYQVYGSSRSEATGLSIYYPIGYQGTDELNIFRDINPCSGYVTLVESIVYGTYTGDASSYEDEAASSGSNVSDMIDSGTINANTYSGNVAIQDEAQLDDDGNYWFSVTEDSIDSIQMVTMYLYQQLDEDGPLYFLGSDSNVNCDWDSGTFSDNFTGTWVCLPDGQELMFDLLEMTDGYNLYTAPISLNGTDTNLRFMWVWADPNDPDSDDGQYVVLGTWAGLDSSGAAARSFEPINPGDVIIPYYIDSDDEEYYGNEYTVSGALVLEDMTLTAGDYYYGFTITDTYGHTTDTEAVIFNVDEDGEVSYYEY